MTEEPQPSPSFEAWSCDDITPDLCKLQVETGRVQVKGNNTVSFWKWFMTENQNQDDDHDHDERMATTNNNNDDATPLVIIPGGPAWGHDYLLSLKQQACRGRVVYFYDPLGMGKSSRIVSSKEMPPLLLDYYATEELPALLEAWNLITTQVSLLGHGFGGMIALSYALFNKKRTTRTKLQSLVLLSTPGDIQLYYDAQWDTDDGTLGQLPHYTQERIHALIHQEAYDSPEYQQLVQAQYPLWLTRTWPPVDCVLDSWKHKSSKASQRLTNSLLGPAHAFMLDITQASLANFNVTDQLVLPDLATLPVLLLSGEFDSVRPIVVDTLADALPNSERIIIPNAAHLTMIDQPKLVNDAIGDFLERVDQGIYYPIAATEQAAAAGRPMVGPWFVLAFFILATMGTMSCLLVGRQIQERRRRHQAYELIL
jgi:proline-specific peptidase